MTEDFTQGAGSPIDLPTKVRHTGAMLKIKDISYSIDGRVLIDHATATIPTGHKVGLVGRNGTGKTTLFRPSKT